MRELTSAPTPFERLKDHVANDIGIRQTTAKVKIGALNEFGGAGLETVKCLDQIAIPKWGAIGELEFEDDLVSRADERVFQFGADLAIEAGHGADISIKGNAHLVIVVVDVGFAVVSNVHFRARIHF